MSGTTHVMRSEMRAGLEPISREIEPSLGPTTTDIENCGAETCPGNLAGGGENSENSTFVGVVGHFPVCRTPGEIPNRSAAARSSRLFHSQTTATVRGRTGAKSTRSPAHHTMLRRAPF